jgi:hypothetical protein
MSLDLNKESTSLQGVEDVKTISKIEWTATPLTRRNCL